jgi:hypothetical protein
MSNSLELIPGSYDELIHGSEFPLPVVLITHFLFLDWLKIGLHEDHSPGRQVVLILHLELLGRFREDVLCQKLIASKKFLDLSLRNDGHYRSEVVSVDEVLRLDEGVLQDVHEISHE